MATDSTPPSPLPLKWPVRTGPSVAVAQTNVVRTAKPVSTVPSEEEGREYLLGKATHYRRPHSI
jgi:hypothetical protein